MTSPTPQNTPLPDLPKQLVFLIKSKLYILAQDLFLFLSSFPQSDDTWLTRTMPHPTPFLLPFPCLVTNPRCNIFYFLLFNEFLQWAPEGFARDRPYLTANLSSAANRHKFLTKIKKKKKKVGKLSANGCAFKGEGWGIRIQWCVTGNEYKKQELEKFTEWELFQYSQRLSFPLLIYCILPYLFCISKLRNVCHWETSTSTHSRRIPGPTKKGPPLIDGGFVGQPRHERLGNSLKCAEGGKSNCPRGNLLLKTVQ